MAIQVFVLLVSLLALLATVFGQGALWFRIVVAIFALVVIGWVGLQAWPTLKGGWLRYRGKRRLEAIAHTLFRDLLDLVRQFDRYVKSNRSDNIPYMLNTLRQQTGLDLPLPDTSVYHVLRLYETLGRRLPERIVSASQLRELAADFGNLLELYHRQYIMAPYEKARTTYFQLSPSGSESPLRAELEVYREQYNEYLRATSRFGSRVNDAFGEHVFPVYLEPVKPLKS